MSTTKMTVAHAILKFLDNQYVSMDGVETKFVQGFFTFSGTALPLAWAKPLTPIPASFA